MFHYVIGAVRAFNIVKELPVYVVKADDVPLFGLDWCLAFNTPMPTGAKLCTVLTKGNKIVETNSTGQLEINKLLEDFQELFTNQIGTIRGHYAKIHVPEHIKPKAFRPRPVPIALRD
ncbi:hypothetical protein QE152_g13608 [Popillia japonica]|uniref:Uncharacterized protein n=1 Tax=Popillia japonica TaxID=7064 RepID=A0AAW1LD53_POPJA